MSSVGSDQVQAAQPADEAAQTAPEAGQAATETSGEASGDASGDAAPAVVHQTVAAITPVFADHSRQIRLSGETQADKSVLLAARANGIIAELDVTKGQRVAEGDVLMRLEGPELQAALANAKMSLDQRARELDADQKLADSGNMADLPLVAAKSAKAAAEAMVSQAQAELDKLVLRAPFAGVIDQVPVEPGQWVQTGTTVAALMSYDPIVVRAELGELDVGDIAVGAKATVHLVDGREAEGTVRFLSRSAEKITRTYPLEVALDNPDAAIPAGMTAEIVLSAPPVRSIIVPRSVITLNEAGEIGLRTVDAQNVTHFAKVTLVGDRPEGLILAGVPEGVRIIVAGQDLVGDGQTVDVKDPPPGFAGVKP